MKPPETTSNSRPCSEMKRARKRREEPAQGDGKDGRVPGVTQQESGECELGREQEPQVPGSLLPRQAGRPRDSHLGWEEGMGSGHPGKEVGPIGTPQEEEKGGREGQGGAWLSSSSHRPSPSFPTWRGLSLLHLSLSPQASHTCLLQFPRPFSLEVRRCL